MTSGRKGCACARRRESATCLRRSWVRRRGRLQHGFLEHCDKRGLRTSANLCLHRGVVLIKQERSVGTLQAPTQRSSAMMLSRSQRPRAPERARCRARYRPAAPQPQSSPRRCRRHTQLCRCASGARITSQLWKFVCTSSEGALELPLTQGALPSV